MKARFYIFSLIFAVCAFTSFDGRAGTVDPSCSQDFNDVLEARAWLSAKREVEMAETIILRAGSVTSTALLTTWRNAQCRDFNINEFRTFSELQATDPRTLAPACSEAGRAGKWSAAITAAAPVPATPAASGGMDAIVSYLDYITWMVAPDCNSIDPIPTGVMADRDDTGPLVAYEDKVCPVPSCYFDPVNLSSTTDDRCRDEP